MKSQITLTLCGGSSKDSLHAQISEKLFFYATAQTAQNPHLPIYTIVDFRNVDSSFVCFPILQSIHYLQQHSALHYIMLCLWD